MPATTIEHLIKLLAKLPGLGPRSARRTALYLMQHKDSLLMPLVRSLEETASTMLHCSNCGNLDSRSPCHICEDPGRQVQTICVVEEVADLWAIERSGVYRGMFHVLGGTLSAIDGRGPEALNIDTLLERIEKHKVEEVILATNATVEGQTTAHYITERIKPLGVKISQIAHGIPIGGELDYLDDGTLGTALQARREAS